MDAPPGLTAEPVKLTWNVGQEEVSGMQGGLQQQAGLLLENAALVAENARLAAENTLLQENARLAQENVVLRMQSQQGAVMALGGISDIPPYGCWPPAEPWMTAPMQSNFDPSQFCEQPTTRKSSAKKQSRIWAWLKHGGSQGGDSFETPSTMSPTSSFTGCSTKTNSFSIESVASNDHRLDLVASPPLMQVPQTTVMMRNIPNNYTREMLLELLDTHDFAGEYDLVYLPMDFKTEAGLGYAFINLVKPESVWRFRDRFHGFRDWAIVSEKVCEVSWSDVLQGIDAHVARYRNSPVMHESVPDDFKPVLFANGERLPFPAPTRKIRAPRQWSRRQQSA